MLVFPQWRSEIPGEGCRVPRWMPAERFAPYLARPVPLAPLPPQVEDEDSLGSSSSERHSYEQGENIEGFCGWRGCGARFPSVARLSAHVTRTHAIAHRDGLFYCGWKSCSRPHRGFNARYKMLVHVRTHTNERPHTCSQCNKSFSRAENLKIHLRSHSGEKPYVCPYEGCGKAYSNSSDRFKHTRTHAVEKPYCCKVPGCNKRYTDPSSLRKHVKTYKHSTTEQTVRHESSDELSPEFSPSKENCSYIQPYDTPRNVSPAVYNTVLPDAPVTQLYSQMDSHVPQVRYIRPLEPVYQMRVPAEEMSYIEYSQMYEHAYRSYYSNVHYPVITPINEKVYAYEDQSSIDDKIMEVQVYNPIEEDMPLNLICSKRIECKPIEELVRRTDLPLDLSTKS
ncbi:hypothetical protein K1T71_003132 [Dendrolimus kikuchii]|uniref:Uncharacterized protein n=1 Tax=Dendrolimus kikuchii TaxID=765133 RepID=A0ACC1DBS9_9NEOP|nr:hypothetical protein K1T71_003132 [Dendrolimus kikuchii]